MSPIINMFSQARVNNVPFLSPSYVVPDKASTNLTVQSINMPQAFLVTGEAFKIFLSNNTLQLPLLKILEELDTKKFSNIIEIGKAARQLVLNHELPHTLEVAIRNAHYKLCGEETNVSVTVQGSATTKSAFSTVYTHPLESFVNIRGEDALTNAIHKCFASLFSERLIKHFPSTTINLDDIEIAISVQKVAVNNFTSTSGNQEFIVDRLKSFNKIMSFKAVEPSPSF
jgi:pyruvate,water dikinase